jgi:hypothetical protein
VPVEGSVRLNVTLDAEHAVKLERLARRTYAQEGSLARSLLSRAIDEADPDTRDTPDVPKGIWEFIKTYFDRKKRAEQENYPTALLIAVSNSEEPDYGDPPDTI